MFHMFESFLLLCHSALSSLRLRFWALSLSTISLTFFFVFLVVSRYTQCASAWHQSKANLLISSRYFHSAHRVDDTLKSHTRMSFDKFVPSFSISLFLLSVFVIVLPIIFWQLFRNLPWFESTILKPIYDNGFRFESDQHISEFRSPVLIMHAENDRVVPYELGYKLYRTALEQRGKSWGPVEFHRFEQKFGHKYIVRAQNLPAVLEQFIDKYKSADYWAERKKC